MITGTAEIRQVPDWQAELARAVTDPAELLALTGLTEEWLPAARAAAACFPLRVPRGFIDRMGKGDPGDPLLRQVLPLADELQVVPGFGSDPVGERTAMRAPGVLQKYRGRVLLTATGACAVHCRYCFRREFPYDEANAAADRWRTSLSHVAADTSIEEVILSGGDPLVLSDRRLAEFINELNGIRHVRRLRIHSRLPVVLPARVNSGLSEVLAGTKARLVIVIHANHAQELDASVRHACARLQGAGVQLLNQSVLLRGVNDAIGILKELSERLFELGVIPYYLHMLDRVAGAAHFDVPESRATHLLSSLHAILPGYLVPRLVREQPGAPGKTTVW